MKRHNRAANLLSQRIVSLLCWAVVGVLLVFLESASRLEAAQPESVEASPSFSEILDRQTRATFAAISEYVQQNPQAADAERAYRWLLVMAQTHALQAEAIPIAEEYLKRQITNASTENLARQVRILGLSRSGRMDEALAGFDSQLKGIRLRAPNTSVDFAIELSSEAQLAGNFAVAREVLERLSQAFFLNPFVRDLCENRLAKLELANQAAPEIGTADFDGKSFDLSDYKGKVVLVDFWATNCPPCLEEFPAMKQLYAEFHPQGLEIVGITLDQQRETVDAFQQQAKLPWRLVMSNADRGATRGRYRVRTIPSLFLLDRKGQIVRIDVRGHHLRRAVEQVLHRE